MIAGNKNFFVAHYDWIAAGVGALALLGAGAFYFMGMGEDPETAAVEACRPYDAKPSETGVKAVDMSAFQNAMRVTKSPVLVAEVPEKYSSFLASERRVLCKCGKAISGDVRKYPKCPYCGEKQQEEVEVVVDADKDGLPDEWERKYGLNMNDPSDAGMDSDGDDFTNLEEYTFKTNPKDKNDHPDYLDSLKIVLPPKETQMPFAFRKANKIPSGWRCEFLNPMQKDNYGRRGTTLTAIVGKEIADADGKGSGFVVKDFTEKSERQSIKGSEGLTKMVDVSEVTVERIKDGKVFKLVVQHGKNVKLAPMDVQVTLQYERGSVKTFDVVPGSEIVLSGVKYRISKIDVDGKKVKIVVENSLTTKKRVLEALAQ